MNAIIDSGSTKSKWVFFDSESTKTIITSGINPYYQSSNEIKNQIEQELLKQVTELPALDRITYYGAGCDGKETKDIIYKGLKGTFTSSKIEVEHDLLAAARALFLNQSGIACIAGTGSNSCSYDGTKIIENIFSPGLSLGDEGSGGYLGKLLIRDYIRNQLPSEVNNLFEKFTSDRTPEIMHKVYKEPFPNRYLASYARFVIENKEEPYLKRLVYQNFDELFINCITKYKNYESLPIRFIGSVAYMLTPTLKEVAKKYNTTIDRVDKDPMDGLLKFHTDLYVVKE